MTNLVENSRGYNLASRSMQHMKNFRRTGSWYRELKPYTLGAWGSAKSLAMANSSVPPCVLTLLLTRPMSSPHAPALGFAEASFLINTYYAGLSPSTSPSTLKCPSTMQSVLVVLYCLQIEIQGRHFTVSPDFTFQPSLLPLY